MSISIVDEPYGRVSLIGRVWTIWAGVDHIYGRVWTIYVGVWTTWMGEWVDLDLSAGG